MLKTTFLILLVLLLSACGGGDIDDGGNSPTMATGGGVAAKGPFKTGATVTACQLTTIGVCNNNANSGGDSNSVSTTVIDDTGAYNFTNINWSGATEITVSGEYFDENDASTKAGSLAAIIEATQGSAFTANINIFTDLATQRIKTLINEGMDLDAAEISATAMVKKVFSLLLPTNVKLTDLDLTDGENNQQDNTELLKFSAAISKNIDLLETLRIAITDGDINNDVAGTNAIRMLINNLPTDTELNAITDRLNDIEGISNAPNTDRTTNYSPILGTLANQNKLLNDANFDIGLSAYDLDSDPLTFSVNSSNTNVAMATLTATTVATATLSIDVGNLGISNIVVSVTDGNATITQTIILTVQKNITITAEPKSKVFNTPENSDPELTYSISGGLETGDTLTGELIRETGEDAGSYAINQGTLANSNYIINYIGANFVIIKANQPTTTISISNTDKTVTEPDFVPIATGSSSSGGVIITHSSNAAVAIVANNQVHIIGAGSSTITAYQQGDNNYNDSDSINFLLTVTGGRLQPLVIIRIEFNDTSFTSNVDFWSDRIFGSNNYGELNHYFNEISQNSFQLKPALETDDTDNDGIITIMLNKNHPNPARASFRTEITAAITAADEFIDFSQYDTNNNNFIDRSELQLMFLVAGPESAFGGLDSGIWAHGSSISTVNKDGVNLRNYSVFGERHDDHNATIGIIAHELGHTALSLPDLYDTNGDSSGIGYFGLMGAGSWTRKANEEAGQTPVHMSAWSKIEADFIIPTTLTGVNNDLSVTGTSYIDYQAYKVETGTNNEYFLIENRAPAGYDLGLYRLDGISFGNTFPGGLLILHIDENQSGNQNEDRKLVDVEEANNAGLDDETDRGHINNLFFNGNNSTFNTSSSPNSNSYDEITSGLSISNIPAAGVNMTIDVTTN